MLSTGPLLELRHRRSRRSYVILILAEDSLGGFLEIKGSFKSSEYDFAFPERAPPPQTLGTPVYEKSDHRKPERLTITNPGRRQAQVSTLLRFFFWTLSVPRSGNLLGDAAFP